MNSKKDSLPRYVKEDLGRYAIMPFLVLLLAIVSLAIAAVAFHSDNTSTQNQSDSDGLSPPGGTSSTLTTVDSSSSGYYMSSWAPNIPLLIHSAPSVIYTSLTVVGPEEISIDMSPRMYIFHDWLTVPPNAVPLNVPETVSIFETSVEGSVCTFSSGDYLPGKGEVLLNVPVMYRTIQPDETYLQVLWLIHINFIDTLIDTEGSFHVR